MSQQQQTIAFLGAATGVGLAALKNTLVAGHKCVALARTPSKLNDALGVDLASSANLKVIHGNAHELAAIKQLLKKEDDGNIVDAIVSTIGARPAPGKMLSIEDPHVCGKAMKVLLQALTELRAEGASGKPLIVACSTTGMSKFGREVPLAMVPFYSLALKVPRADKQVMEDALVDSGEEFTIIRPSLLQNGESEKTIRVGIEDPKTGREVQEMGFAISREDAGRWVAVHLLLKNEGRYKNKIATLTY
jgi:nucleoside-diphosphate-sugar epimerase